MHAGRRTRARMATSLAVLACLCLTVAACDDGSAARGGPESATTTDAEPRDDASHATDADIDADADADIVIDNAADGTPIDQRLFGTNVPAWLGVDHLARPEFIAETVELGTTLLRFPGGSWSNWYDWLACQRGNAAPESADAGDDGCHWTWAATPSDFMDFMAATDLPAMWTVSANATAHEAAALVAFFNGEVGDTTVIGNDRHDRDWGTVGRWAELRASLGHPDPVPIHLWEFGNEVFGTSGDAVDGCADFGWEETWTCDGTEYVTGIDGHDGYLEVREEMLAVDGSISVGAVGVTEQDSWGDWGSEVLDAAGDALDFYVIHHYAFSGDARLDGALERPQEQWPEVLADVADGLAERDGPSDVPVAVTEYNLVAFQDGDADALMSKAVNMLFLADTIGQLAVGGVDIATQWNLANGAAPNGADYGLLEADTLARNPSFYALALWSRFGTDLLPISSTFDPANELSVYAGRTDDGRVSLLAINKTGDPIEATLQVDGLPEEQTAVRADAASATALGDTEVAFNGSLEHLADLDAAPPVAEGAVTDGRAAVTFAGYSLTLVRIG